MSLPSHASEIAALFIIVFRERRGGNTCFFIIQLTYAIGISLLNRRGTIFASDSV